MSYLKGSIRLQNAIFRCVFNVFRIDFGVFDAHGHPFRGAKIRDATPRLKLWAIAQPANPLIARWNFATQRVPDGAQRFLLHALDTASS